MRCLPRYTLNGGALHSRVSHTGPEAAQPAAEGRTGRIRENAFPGPGTAGRKGFAAAYARRKGERGAAILESFFSMILLGIILFGVLQLFQLVAASMVTDYAAFRGARSAAVGFKDEYAFREAQIKVAPVSGSLITPNPDNYPGFRNNSDTEKSILREFMQDNCVVRYANWSLRERLHTEYSCPNYGTPLEGTCPICGSEFSGRGFIHMESSDFGDSQTFRFSFINYPLHLPLYDWITGYRSVTISGEAELSDHSSAFLRK